MNRDNTPRFRRLVILLTLLGIVYGCIDGDFLAPDPDAAVITDFSPTRGPVGTVVTIRGQGFGGSTGSDSVFINGYGAEVLSSSSTQLTVVIPVGATTGPIIVEVLSHRRRAVSPGDFEVIALEGFPVITKVEASSGVVGASFQIIGENFGADVTGITVRIGQDTTEVTAINDSTIVTRVPIGAETGPVSVAIDGYLAVGPVFTVLDADPEITLLKPDHGPIGTMVWIIGGHFSSVPEQNGITFNGVAAQVLEAYNDSLKTSVPPGATSGLVRVTVNGRNGEWPLFTVDAIAPIIDSIDPTSGQVGTTVTIKGSNFSDSPSDNTVTFNGAEATVLTATTVTLQVAVPPDATTGPVNVEVDGVTAIGPVFTVVSSDPIITSINPTSGKPGDNVTINGQNFGATVAANAVTFNDVVAFVTSASPTTLVVIVPVGATTGPVKVVVNGITATGPQFVVESTQVEVTTINPTSGQVGTPVTITGNNFGATIALNQVTFNGSIATITSANTTQIVAVVPPGATTGPVVVTVGGLSGIGPTFTVLPTPPQITALNPNAGQVGTSIKILGNNFSATVNQNTVTFNGTNATVITASTTELTATVPVGATTGNVVVTVGGLASNGVTFTVLQTPPQITTLNPDAGQIGISIKIIGSNFSATANQNSVTFNGTSAIVTNASTTELTVTVPAGATTGNVVVTVGGLASNGVTFTVQPTPPQITALNPNAGQVGTSIKIIGNNFSTTANQNTINFNGTSATVTNASSTELVVTVPVGATTGNVVVTVGGLVSNGVNFTVQPSPPQITALNPNAGQVGASINIIGNNFSATPNQNTVTFNGTNATVTSASTTTLVVTVPAGATTGSVVVTVGGLTSNGLNFIVQPTPPQITSINPTSGPFDTNVTITGTNFSAVFNENTVSFNGNPAVITTASPTSIVAVVPLGAGTGPVTVTVNGQTSNGVNFNYIKTAMVNTYAGTGSAGFVDGPGTSAQFNGPSRMDINAGGEIIIADFNNHSIRRIDTKGQVTTLAGNGTSGYVNGTLSQARFARPLGIAIDNAGNIYVADFDNHVIRRISTSNVVSTYAGSGQAGFADGTANAAAFNGPVDVEVDGSGNLYVADLYNHAIRRIATNGVVTTLAGNGTSGFVDSKGTAARFNSPDGLGIDNQSNVYVADLANHAIRKITPTGDVTTIAGNGTPGSADGSLGAARFNFPYDVDLDAAGNIYVADDKNHKIRVITTNNTVQTFAGSGVEGFQDGQANVARFNDPTGIRVVNSELMYVGDTENNRVRIITVE
jgi:hypothetical protein